MLFAFDDNSNFRFLCGFDVRDIQSAGTFFAVHQPATESHVPGFPRIYKVRNRISVILPAIVSYVIIAAVNIAVVDVAGRVDRLDMVIAAAHNRAKHFTLAIGEVRANDYVVV